VISPRTMSILLSGFFMNRPPNNDEVTDVIR
jgi:hypothetical protein